jgi:hypothetical protein
MSEQFPFGKSADDDNLNERPRMIYEAGVEPRYLVPAGGGDIIDLNLVVERDKAEEAFVHTDMLCAGDTVRITCEKPDDILEGSFTFEIETADWTHLSLNSGPPSKMLIGRLTGADVPEKIIGLPVRLEGSGFGGSTLSRGVLVTNRYTYFALLDEKYRGQEWHSQKITDIEILRANEQSGVMKIEPEWLAKEAYVDNPSHSERLKRAVTLMAMFGYDNDFTDASLEAATLSGYREVRTMGDFVANYISHGATGNHLQLFNTRTCKVTQINYYNYSNEDILKIGQYDVEPDDFHEPLLNANGKIHTHASKDKDKICYTTSNRYSLETIDIRVSDEKARRHLQLVAVPAGQPSAEITLFGDGSSVIKGNYFARLAAHEDPTILDKIRAKIRAGKDANGNSLVMVGNEVVDLHDPIDQLDEIIDDLLPSDLQSLDIA